MAIALSSSPISSLTVARLYQSVAVSLWSPSFFRRIFKLESKQFWAILNSPCAQATIPMEFIVDAISKPSSEFSK